MDVIYTNLTRKAKSYDEYEFCKLNDLLKEQIMYHYTYHLLKRMELL